MRQVYNKTLKIIRQELRKNPTEPEKKMWSAIRNNQCCQVKFRRQCSIGNYVVDFYSIERKLVIEIDGNSHYTEDGLEKDKSRDAFLRAQGNTVIRFTNHEVMTNHAGCFEYLEHYLMTGELREK